MGWVVNVTPRPLFTPGKDPVPIVQEAGWTPGPVWTGAENLVHIGIRSPDRPARSQSLYRLRYPAHHWVFRSLVFRETGSRRFEETYCLRFQRSSNLSRLLGPWRWRQHVDSESRQPLSCSNTASFPRRHTAPATPLWWLLISRSISLSVTWFPNLHGCTVHQ